MGTVTMGPGRKVSLIGRESSFGKTETDIRETLIWARNKARAFYGMQMATYTKVLGKMTSRMERAS